MTFKKTTSFTFFKLVGSIIFNIKKEEEIDTFYSCMYIQKLTNNVCFCSMK